MVHQLTEPVELVEATTIAIHSKASLDCLSGVHARIHCNYRVPKILEV
jgi:hypothetical protein